MNTSLSNDSLSTCSPRTGTPDCPRDSFTIMDVDPPALEAGTRPPN